jgi:hypothetical protein
VLLLRETRVIKIIRKIRIVKEIIF